MIIILLFNDFMKIYFDFLDVGNASNSETIEKSVDDESKDEPLEILDEDSDVEELS